MRIIFIPGLGEDEFIFDKIINSLPGHKLVLSLWKLLPDQRATGLNVAACALEVIRRYQVTAEDLVIGHSTGGWLALHIKQAAGCTVIQLASWTDSKKVIVPAVNRRLIYFAAQTGLYLNPLLLRWSVKKHYRGKPSQSVFEQVFRRLITGNRSNAVNQLRLIFNPVLPVSVVPDLRIHARGDRIIRFPDGPAEEVPGDHFSLYTYPGEVVALIKKFIETYVSK